MTSEHCLDQITFQQQLEKLYREQPKGDALARLRAKGWEQFQTVGLPTRQMETYQYVRLRQLYAKSYSLGSKSNLSPSQLEPYILPECSDSAIVFVNGKLDLSLSRLKALPKKALLVSMKEALRSFSSLIQNQTSQILHEERDPFAALNAAFAEEALFFYLPPRSILDTPLQILHYVDTQQKLLFPRVELFFGAQSEAHIVGTYIDLMGTNLINSSANFAMEEGAQVAYTRLGLKGSASWHFEATRAVLKRDASFKSLVVQNGAENFRDDYKVILAGTNAEANLTGVGLLQGLSEAHTHVHMEHQAPVCRSLQLFKGALADASHASFEGKILVRREAQKTEAFQLNNHLLLSDQARAESKPNLEIFADDVKASHGATVGQLNAEELFYMQARGLAEKDARNLLIQAFCNEVIDQISLPTPLQIAIDHIKGRVYAMAS